MTHLFVGLLVECGGEWAGGLYPLVRYEVV
jgi:hypothetical protein